MVGGVTIFRVFGTIASALLISYVIRQFTASPNDSEADATVPAGSDPCCAFPCQNNAVCLSEGSSYECDCSNIGYYGIRCEKPYLSTRIVTLLKPSPRVIHSFLTNFKLLWKIVNNWPWARKKIMKIVLQTRLAMISEPSPYVGETPYPSLEGYLNKSMYYRALPPVPENCPTPMGVKGKPALPDVDVLLEKFFRRRQFIPCNLRSSVLFPFFAQQFTHMFFHSDTKRGNPFQLGSHTFDVSNVYGGSPERRRLLRLGKSGKLKYSMINGEMYPPLADDVNDPIINGVDRNYQFALAQPRFNFMPTFLVISTLWLREHNRICDILVEEHPSWDDERLYRTAKLIIIAETIKIVIEDYVQHISGFAYELLYEPQLLHDSGFSYHGEIHMEFQTLYHWHPLMPDAVAVANRTYEWGQTLYNFKPFVDAGMRTVLHDLSRQVAGKLSEGRNQGLASLKVARKTILQDRKDRVQSFNNYRKKFGMAPYTSFEELTGETEKAGELRELYGDIGSLEYFVGLVVEKQLPQKLLGETLVEMIAPHALKGVMANPINSPAWWKPSSFGGERAFDIIKTTNLQELVCRNVKDCPKVSFKVIPGEEITVKNTIQPYDITTVTREANAGKDISDELKEAWSARKI